MVATLLQLALRDMISINENMHWFAWSLTVPSKHCEHVAWSQSLCCLEVSNPEVHLAFPVWFLFPTDSFRALWNVKKMGGYRCLLLLPLPLYFWFFWATYASLSSQSTTHLCLCLLLYVCCFSNGVRGFCSMWTYQVAYWLGLLSGYNMENYAWEEFHDWQTSFVCWIS